LTSFFQVNPSRFFQCIYSLATLNKASDVIGRLTDGKSHEITCFTGST